MNGRRRFVVSSAALAACLLAGCVERRFVITTDPPGAVVTDERGIPIGAAPVDRSWVYNGVYQFKIDKDGFETQVVRENVAAKWYEYFPFDFVAENVIPWTIRDVRRFHYQLQPMAMMSPETLLQQGQVLRQRGVNVGVPLPPQAPRTPAPAGAAPPAAPQGFTPPPVAVP